MIGSIQNRDAFLANIGNRLGRKPVLTGVEKPVWKHSPQEDVLKNANLDELVEVLEVQCTKIHTNLVRTDADNLKNTLKSVVADYGGGPVLAWDDPRFRDMGMSDLFEGEGLEFNYWNHSKGEENIKLADVANVGITMSDITLAESGTVVLFSGKDRGRTLNFLPAVFIAIVPKSTLVPRITQAARLIRERVANGETVPSCINFITGPSNSADIELNLVVGVHGPVKAVYVLVDDL